MAVNKVIYHGNTLLDLTSDTVTPSTLLKGITAHDKSGARITGTNITGTNTDEIDRIMTAGLTDGYKSYSDDGTIISTTDSKGRVLTKTFSNNFKTCTTVLKDQNGVVLGKVVRTFSDDTGTVTATDSKGQVLTKSLSANSSTFTSILKDSSGNELARKVETFTDTGTTSTFSYT